MNYIHYLFISLTLYLGFITSYTDIKEGKIRNKHIIFTMIFGSICYAYLLLFDVISIKIIFLMLINLGIGTIVSVSLWYLGLWSAGDAKLFSVYLFVLPPFFYKYQTYTFLTFFINIILPICIFYIVALFLKTSVSEKMCILKKYFSFENLLLTFLLTFGMGWITKAIFTFLNLPKNILLSMLLMIGIDKFIRKFWHYNVLYIYVVISIFRIVFNFYELLSGQFWLSFFVFTLGFIILRGLIFDISFLVFSKDIKVNDLKVGMIPAENIKKSIKNSKIVYDKVSMTHLFCLSQIQNEQYLLTNAIEGLTKKDIDTLRKLSIPTIKIQQAIPFAPFMFAGSLIIIFFGVDIITALYVLIHPLFGGP